MKPITDKNHSMQTSIFNKSCTSLRDQTVKTHERDTKIVGAGAYLGAELSQAGLASYCSQNCHSTGLSRRKEGVKKNKRKPPTL